MNFDFAAFLLFATLATGLVWVVDKCYWRKQRLAILGAQAGDQEPIIIEYCRSFFPVLLIVLILRSFVAEPYRIPSGSMKPTLLVGDFILVNKYTYGLRLPVFRTKILDISEPKRGDVFVFKYPVDPGMNFIKRVIGLPGDKIDYRNKQLYINGELMSKADGKTESFIDEYGQAVTAKRFIENLGDVKHTIYERDVQGREVVSITVPQGHYFAMGDNRDDSDDSRVWGFVPEENIVGKAVAVWLSVDTQHFGLRFDNVPRKIS